MPAGRGAGLAGGTARGTGEGGGGAQGGGDSRGEGGGQLVEGPGVVAGELVCLALVAVTGQHGRGGGGEGALPLGELFDGRL